MFFSWSTAHCLPMDWQGEELAHTLTDQVASKIYVVYLKTLKITKEKSGTYLAFKSISKPYPNH